MADKDNKKLRPGDPGYVGPLDIAERGIDEADFVPDQELKDEAVKALGREYPALPDWALTTLAAIPLSVRGGTKTAKAAGEKGAKYVEKKIAGGVEEKLVPRGSKLEKILDQTDETVAATRHPSTPMFKSGAIESEAKRIQLEDVLQAAEKGKEKLKKQSTDWQRGIHRGVK